MSSSDETKPRIPPELLARAEAKKQEKSERGDGDRIPPELLARSQARRETSDSAMSKPPERPARPPSRSRRPGRPKQSVAVSVFLGIMLVPLSAVAAMFLIGPRVEPVKAEAATVVAADPAGSGDDLANDITTACGPDGLALTELERSGDISQLQQAALDALRPICTDNGLPLPAAPIPTPVTETIVVQAPAPAPATGQTVSDDHDDDDHDDHDDDDHDDHDDDDDDHDDDDHDEDDD